MRASMFVACEIDVSSDDEAWALVTRRDAATAKLFHFLLVKAIV